MLAKHKSVTIIMVNMPFPRTGGLAYHDSSVNSREQYTLCCQAWKHKCLSQLVSEGGSRMRLGVVRRCCFNLLGQLL
eukprot:6477399-Amphidinium_carterae.2